MANKDDLRTWVADAVGAHDGAATIVEVAIHIWSNHESELRESDRLFYTWQYDMRWCALELRKSGTLVAAASSPPGTWVMAS